MNHSLEHSRNLNLSSQTLTFADEALFGDGLLAYITALGLLERLQLEGVCVDALQLVGLWEEERGRWIRRESANRNTQFCDPYTAFLQ